MRPKPAIKGGNKSMAKLAVGQQGQYYHIFLPSGIQIALIWLGEDKQYTKDAVTINRVVKILSERWGINPKQ